MSHVTLNTVPMGNIISHFRVAMLDEMTFPTRKVRSYVEIKIAGNVHRLRQRLNHHCRCLLQREHVGVDLRALVTEAL